MLDAGSGCALSLSRSRSKIMRKITRVADLLNKFVYLFLVSLQLPKMGATLLLYYCTRL
jgi:hypothetical protein